MTFTNTQKISSRLNTQPSICYLCGDPLTKPISRDHVPPQQIYADDVRKTQKLNLRTIRVHKKCNSAYQHDEDYFVNTLAPFGRGSYAGDAFLKEVFQKFGEGKKKGLVLKVYEEFERQPSGLILPPGLVKKRFEDKRLQRVAWKIIRGLYFYQFDAVLPESTPNLLELFSPDRPPPVEFFQLLGNEPNHGRYPGVFDYSFAKFTGVCNLNYWAMLLWDKIIMTMKFHDPTCECEDCAITVKPEAIDDQPEAIR